MLFLLRLCSIFLIFAKTSASYHAKSTVNCENPQKVFDGNLGVVFELLPGSPQKNNVINFVEKFALNSNFYSLSYGSDRPTLATTVPYPTTHSYNVQPYGSLTNLKNVTDQVENFNKNIQPATKTGDIIDAFLNILTNMPAGNIPSALLVVGNSAKMIENNGVVDYLKESFKVYTVAVGDNPADLTPISSGQGYSYVVSNNDDEAIANLIAESLAAMSTGFYCPSNSSTSSPTPNLPTTPSTPPTSCQKPFDGNIAVTVELSATSDKTTTDFISQYLFNPIGYKFDDGTTTAITVPFPNPENSKDIILNYGDATSVQNLTSNMADLIENATMKDSARIGDGLYFIYSHRPPTKAKSAIIIIGKSDEFVKSSYTQEYLTKVKNQGYKVLTVTLGADYSSLASDPSWSFKYEGKHGKSIANQISVILWTSSSTRIAIAYELVHHEYFTALNITNFMRDYLYKSKYYNFINESIHAPYPYTTFDYGDGYILKYGQAQSYYDMATNLRKLFDVSQYVPPGGPYLEDALNFIYNWRNPAGSKAALIIIGHSDDHVKNLETIKWLNLLKQDPNLVTITISFGGDFSSLTSDPAKYSFCADLTDEESLKKVGDQVAKLIAEI